MTLTGKNLTVRAGGRAILDRVSFALGAGELAVIVGPNGAGKSTMLRSLAGDLRPHAGDVAVNGRALGSWNADALALQRAVLPQNPTLAFPFRVCDVVELGRYPHRGLASAQEHRVAVDGAMRAADVTHLAQRDCRTLSGGELHRVHYARALAQIWHPRPDGSTRYLLLDEPTAALDLAHQSLVLSYAKTFSQQGGAVLAILHDLNLAAAFADRLIVLSEGRIAAEGTATTVLTAELIRAVWHVDARVFGDPPTVIVEHRPQSATPRVMRAAE